MTHWKPARDWGYILLRASMIGYLACIPLAIASVLWSDDSWPLIGVCGLLLLCIVAEETSRRMLGKRHPDYIQMTRKRVR